MREMLKRRQFIFGKQNTNRHQPYVDDVVTSVYTQYNNASNISDEDGSEDAVMKFAPTKKEVIDIIKSAFPDGTVVFNISEEDVEFVDTFLYKQGDYDHIGYIYKLTKGSYTVDGNSKDMSGTRVVCAGPVLALDGKVAFVTTREVTEEDFEYLHSTFGIGLMPIFDPNVPSASGGTRKFIVTDFDPHNTGVSVTLLPDPSYIVNITTDVLPYIINHACLSLDNGGGELS